MPASRFPLGPRLAVAAAIAAWIGVATPAARAQGGSPQAQFDYGLAEMEAGRYATGCPALAESYRLDPHPGVLFTLAECENRAGKLASALTHYDAYRDLFAHMSEAEKGRQRGRERVAAAQREKLIAEVPQLSVALPPGAPAGTAVTRDGVLLGAPSLGVAAPVDPGEHVVVARTPDGVAHETRVTLARAEHRAVVVDLRPPPPAPPNGGAPPALSSRAAPDAQVVVTQTSPLRTWAWIAGAAGIAGIAVGSIAGGLVLADKSTIAGNCNPDRSCNQQGLDAASHAHTMGLVSDAGFAVGGAGLVASAVLFLASPSRVVQPVAAADGRGAFVGLRATW
jgi:hypothetical protein